MGHEGEAPLDLWVVDIRRFASIHRDQAFVRDRTLEAYGRHYGSPIPMRSTSRDGRA